MGCLSSVCLWALTPTEDPSLGPGLPVLGRTRCPNPPNPSNSFQPLQSQWEFCTPPPSRNSQIKLSFSKLFSANRVVTWIFWSIFSTPREWDAQLSATFSHSLHQILVKPFLISLQFPLLSCTQGATPCPEHHRLLQDIPGRMSSIATVLYLVEGDKKIYENTPEEVQWDGSSL